MTVLLVEFSPSGGLLQFAVQLADGLAGLGHRVEVLTGVDPEIHPARPGATLVSTLPTWRPQALVPEAAWKRKLRRGLRALRYLEAWRRTWRYAVSTRPDVVQFGEWRFWLDGAIVALLRRRLPHTVLAAVAHSPVPLQEQRGTGALHRTGPLLHRALAAGYAQLDCVFVLGERSRADLLGAFPQVRRVDVVPHGDAARLLPPRLTPAGATPPRVLLFGTLARYKGLDVLLDAWELVRAADPAAQLVVAGAPIDIDVPALRRRAAAVGGMDLRLGYVPVEQVGDLLADVRVVVAPYLAANQSGVVHLAQSAGRPVVVSDVGDLPAVVQQEVTGLVVPAGDPAALAGALLRLLRDPAAAQRLGDAGRDRLLATASWERVAAAIAAAYEQIRGASGTGATA